MRGRVSIAILLFAAAFALHLWWVTRGWNIPGLTGHEFRQTQTAISIWAMREEGFRIDYSTPILGKPWAIPFEFPVYQGIVHVLDQHSHLGVVLAGRWVSLIAFYLGVPAWILLLRRFGFSAGAALVAVLPLFFAPVYLLYSRAVLIESTAFASGAWFLFFLARYRETKRPLIFAATLLTGAVAVLTKATTWAVFCLPWSVCVLADGWSARKSGWRAAARAVIDDGLLIAVPLLAIGLGWVWISDRIKEFNPIGAHLVSHELRAFNFGTLAQRVSGAEWRSLWNHLNLAVMPWWGVALAAVGVWWTSPRTKWVFVLGLVAFVGAPMVFFNLYVIHNYYFYASAWGLCLAVGIVAADWWDAPRRWYLTVTAGLVLLATVAAGQYFAYRRSFLATQTNFNAGDFGLTQAIRRVTGPKDVVVVHNGDWSSALAFWSQRRMLMISDSQMYFHPDDVQRGVQMLANENVPLVLFWGGDTRKHTDWLVKRIGDFHLKWFPAFIWQGEAAAYARDDVFWRVRETLQREPVAGIEMPDAHQYVTFKPAEPIAGTQAEVELKPLFAPVPTRGALPFGVSFRYVDGKKYFLAHPPTEIEFPVPAGAKRVEIACRMEPSVYVQKDFDGAYLTLELQRPDGTRQPLLEEAFPPFGSRSPHVRAQSLPENAEGKIVLRTLPGPTGSYAYDWLLIEYLRVR